MDDLVAWLLAQIAEDELQAERLVEYYIDEPSPSPYRVSIAPAVRRFATKDVVLAECEAKRKVIGKHAPIENGLGDLICDTCCVRTNDGDADGDWPCATVVTYLELYAKLGRPGYQESWRPA